MPSFADSIFLFVLALLLFGPKKLPVLARELGKWMGEFRRASNEFKMQMEDELRASEQAERQQKVAAMEAAAPIPPPLDDPAEPEHPHLRNHVEPDPPDRHTEVDDPTRREQASSATGLSNATAETAVGEAAAPSVQIGDSSSETTTSEVRPLPIATSGSLKMMPPATGLPTPRSSRPNPLAGLVQSVPEVNAEPATANPESEGVAHGD